MLNDVLDKLLNRCPPPPPPPAVTSFELPTWDVMLTFAVVLIITWDMMAYILTPRYPEPAASTTQETSEPQPQDTDNRFAARLDCEGDSA